MQSTQTTQKITAVDHHDYDGETKPNFFARFGKIIVCCVLVLGLIGGGLALLLRDATQPETGYGAPGGADQNALTWNATTNSRHQLLANRVYRIELWGARGGSSGGFGAYVRFYHSTMNGNAQHVVFTVGSNGGNMGAVPTGTTGTNGGGGGTGFPSGGAGGRGGNGQTQQSTTSYGVTTITREGFAAGRGGAGGGGGTAIGFVSNTTTNLSNENVVAMAGGGGGHTPSGHFQYSAGNGRTYRLANSWTPGAGSVGDAGGNNSHSADVRNGGGGGGGGIAGGHRGTRNRGGVGGGSHIWTDRGIAAATGLPGAGTNVLQTGNHGSGHLRITPIILSSYAGRAALTAQFPAAQRNALQISQYNNAAFTGRVAGPGASVRWNFARNTNTWFRFNASANNQITQIRITSATHSGTHDLTVANGRLANSWGTVSTAFGNTGFEAMFEDAQTRQTVLLRVTNIQAVLEIRATSAHVPVSTMTIANASSNNTVISEFSAAHATTGIVQGTTLTTPLRSHSFNFVQGSNRFLRLDAGAGNRISTVNIVRASGTPAVNVNLTVGNTVAAGTQSHGGTTFIAVWEDPNTQQRVSLQIQNMQFQMTITTTATNHWNVTRNFNWPHLTAGQPANQTQTALGNFNAVVGVPAATGAVATNQTPAGYAFNGWWTTAATGGTQIGTAAGAVHGTPTVNNFGSGSSTNTSTLFARWTPLSVRFHRNYNFPGGQASGTATLTNILRNRRPGDAITSNPSRTPTGGYSFGGWWTTADQTGVQLSDTWFLAHAPIWNANSEVTLFAHWVRNPVTITLNHNYGGTPTTVVRTWQHGDNYNQVFGDDPQRNGFTFLGWYTTAATGGYQVTRLMTIPSTGTRSANHTLFARWVAWSNIIINAPAQPVLSNIGGLPWNSLLTWTRPGTNSSVAGWAASAPTDSIVEYEIRINQVVRARVPGTVTQFDLATICHGPLGTRTWNVEVRAVGRSFTTLNHGGTSNTVHTSAYNNQRRGATFNTSAWSTVRVYIVPNERMNAPTNLSASGTTLTWVPDGREHTTRVYIDGTSIGYVPGNTLNLGQLGLAARAGNPYQIQLRAISLHGVLLNSAPSAEHALTVTQGQGTRLLAPGNLNVAPVVEGNNTQFQLVWNRPTNAGATALTYFIYADGVRLGTVPGSQASAAVVTFPLHEHNLNPGQRILTVRAEATGFTPSTSAVHAHNMIITLNAPNNVRVEDNMLRWNNNNNHVNRVLSYRVYTTLTGGTRRFTGITIASPTREVYINSIGLLPGMNQIQIRAIGAHPVVSSGYSTIVASANHPVEATLAAPVVELIEGATNSVRWAAVLNASNYEVRITNTTTDEVVTLPISLAVHRNLPPLDYGVHRIEVRTIGISPWITSPWSTEILIDNRYYWVEFHHMNGAVFAPDQASAGEPYFQSYRVETGYTVTESVIRTPSRDGYIFRYWAFFCDYYGQYLPFDFDTPIVADTPRHIVAIWDAIYHIVEIWNRGNRMETLFINWSDFNEFRIPDQGNYGGRQNNFGGRDWTFRHWFVRGENNAVAFNFNTPLSGGAPNVQRQTHLGNQIWVAQGYITAIESQWDEINFISFHNIADPLQFWDKEVKWAFHNRGWNYLIPMAYLTYIERLGAYMPDMGTKSGYLPLGWQLIRDGEFEIEIIAGQERPRIFDFENRQVEHEDRFLAIWERHELEIIFIDPATNRRETRFTNAYRGWQLNLPNWDRGGFRTLWNFGSVGGAIFDHQQVTLHFTDPDVTRGYVYASWEITEYTVRFLALNDAHILTAENRWDPINNRNTIHSYFQSGPIFDLANSMPTGYTLEWRIVYPYSMAGRIFRPDMAITWDMTVRPVPMNTAIDFRIINFRDHWGTPVAYVRTDEQNNWRVFPPGMGRFGYELVWSDNNGVFWNANDFANRNVRDFGTPHPITWFQANWEQVQHAVTFQGINGTETRILNVTIESGFHLTPICPGIRPGYIFRHWALDGERFNFDIGVINPITLEAVWDNVRIVSFRHGDWTAVRRGYGQYDFQLEIPEFNQGPAYRFTGWTLYGDTSNRLFNLNAGGVFGYMDGANFVPFEFGHGMIFDSNWELILWQVTFVCNDVESPFDYSTATAGFASSWRVTPPHWTRNGWRLYWELEDGTRIGRNYLMNNVVIEQDQTITADWVWVGYTGMFVLNPYAQGNILFVDANNNELYRCEDDHEFDPSARVFLRNIAAGELLTTVIEQFDACPTIVYVYQSCGETRINLGENPDTTVATGQILRLRNEAGNILDEVTIVVAGDVTGSGNLNEYIVQQGRNVYLQISELILHVETGHLQDAFLLAADISGDGVVDLFDVIMLVWHIERIIDLHAGYRIGGANG